MVDESKLVFIISQPRSGSTLTQKLLSNNNLVDTVSEPWLLLPLLSIYKPDIIEAKYNYPVALQGLFDYLKKRNAEADFRNDLKALILNAYKLDSDSLLFVDKTPRYYEILPEIIEIFPRARFLVLKRNPFASLYSMLTTWSRGRVDYKLFMNFYRDFLVAPFLIQEFCDQFGGSANVLELKYEDIVRQPEPETRRMYDWLDIPFNSKVLMIGSNEKVRGIFGDDVYRKEPLEVIKPESSDAWKSTVLSNRELSTFFCEYQKYLSHDFINRYGYARVDFQSWKLLWGRSKFKAFVKEVMKVSTYS